MPDTDYPKLLFKSTEALSPWCSVVTRSIEFAPGAAAETYHSVIGPDYIGILALTPDGRIPIVRQYRPAVEAFAWELPAGMREPDESAELCCRRELMEETGLVPISVEEVGWFYPDTGRLSTRLCGFLARVEAPANSLKIEEGINMKLVTREELFAMVADGRFKQLLHMGLILACQAQGLF